LTTTGPRAVAWSRWTGSSYIESAVRPDAGERGAGAGATARGVAGTLTFGAEWSGDAAVTRCPGTRSGASTGATQAESASAESRRQVVVKARMGKFLDRFDIESTKKYFSRKEVFPFYSWELLKTQ
jgi:hypothetical protein